MNYIALGLTFFFIGAVSFGGGFAMLPLLEKTLVEYWITKQQFLDILAISQATPGAFAINAATYIGAVAMPNAFLGSAIATTTLSMPGFILSYFIAYPMLRAKEHPYVATLMRYLAPTTLGLISYAGLNLFLSELTRNPNWFFVNSKSLFIMVISAFILRFRLLSSIYLIILMAAVGIFLSFL